MGRRREDTKGSCTEQSDVQLFSSGCSCSSWLSTGGSSPWDWQHQTTALVFSSRGDTALQTHLDWHWAGGKSTGNASLHCRERELLHLPSSFFPVPRVDNYAPKPGLHYRARIFWQFLKHGKEAAPRGWSKKKPLSCRTLSHAWLPLVSKNLQALI